jgi:hypothetical protein
MESELVHYSSVLKANRETFLLNHREEYITFENVDKRLNAIAGIIATKRTDKGESIVSLSAFLLMIVRQGRNAIECLSRYQSSEAWLVFRPALEAALVIGKFLDNPENAAIWWDKKQIYENRKTDKTKYDQYRKEFEGDGLIPASLPRGKEFRQLLSKINDKYVHMNSDYFSKDIQINDDGSSEIEMKVHFVDFDQQMQKAQLFSFLHMYCLLVSALGGAFATRFTNETVLIINVKNMEDKWLPKVLDLSKDNSMLKEYIRDYGLWNI